MITYTSEMRHISMCLGVPETSLDSFAKVHGEEDAHFEISRISSLGCTMFKILYGNLNSATKIKLCNKPDYSGLQYLK